jgi:hypothetical protein
MDSRLLLRLMALILPGLGAIPTASADELVLAGKIGAFNIDFEQADQSDPFFAAAVDLGYEFIDMPGMHIGAELQLVTSLTDGDMNLRDYSYESVGAFISLRTSGPVHFIGRLGYVDARLTPENADPIDDNGAAVGLGIGFNTGIRWELELDGVQYKETEDKGLFLSVGLSF